MKKNYKNFAFTLAEVLVVLLVIGIIITAGMGVQRAKKNYVNKFMAYSAFTNLKSGIDELVAEGCTDDDLKPQVDGISYVCKGKSGYIPQVGQGGWGYNNRGLCERLTDKYNIVGNPNCNQPVVSSGTTNFNGLTPNFKVTNSMKFYNFGSNPTQYGSNYVYTVYLDIDGDARKGILGDDVLAFDISTDGGVILDNSANMANVIDTTDYLTADVRYFDRTNQKYVYPVSGLSYRQAICQADAVPASITTPAAYCNGISRISVCSSTPTPPASNSCEVVLDKPHFMFF